MISSLQPSRPRVSSNPAPTNSTPAPKPVPDIRYEAPRPTSMPFHPRNQLEAMPPFPVGRVQAPARVAVLDAASRHPVFFTDRLKKAPNGVSAGGGLWAHPVAQGYVFNDGSGKKEGGVKL